ncbi:MAG: DUF4422 domain-containing protein [Flavobacteriales bacterium]
MKIKILVAHHKKHYIYEDDIFLPIHVGKEDSKINLNMIADNTGDNISSKNKYYCEMTATYWAWKNINDADYIGLCHYRRYFTFKQESFVKKLKDKIKVYFGKSYKLLKRNYDKGIIFEMIKTTPEALNAELNDFSVKLVKTIAQENISVFVTSPVELVNKNIKTHFDIFEFNYLDEIKEIIKNNFPQYLEYYIDTLNSNRIYYANMVIMEKGIFNKYCSFIFSILNIHFEQNKNDIHNEQINFDRLSGYVAELLTNTFILKLKKEIKEDTIMELNTLFVDH